MTELGCARRPGDGRTMFVYAAISVPLNQASDHCPLDSLFHLRHHFLGEEAEGIGDLLARRNVDNGCEQFNI